MMTEAVIRCPFCRFEKKEEMSPTFPETGYTCTQCGKKLTASGAECCVFCKYSDAFCPARQNNRDCCSG